MFCLCCINDYAPLQYFSLLGYGDDTANVNYTAARRMMMGRR